MSAALLLASCSKDEQAKSDYVRPVRLFEVTSLVSYNKDYSGIVSAEEFSELAFRVSGTITSVNVQAGQKVGQGTLIATIDPRDYDLQLETNKAAYLTAKSQLERNERLIQQQAISQQELEIARANYIKTKSAYENAQNVLADTRLKAPFTGFIETKYVENYQKVQPGQPIVKLVNPNKLEVKFTIPDTQIPTLRATDKITVEFETLKGIYFQAAIKEYVEASPDGSGIPVTLRITDPKFDSYKSKVIPGFACRVNMDIDLTKKGQHMYVPLTAVFKDDKSGQTCVWVYQNGKVKRQPITTGALVGTDMIVVQQGLQAGQEVVQAGATYLSEGQAVKVLKN